MGAMINTDPIAILRAVTDLCEQQVARPPKIIFMEDAPATYPLRNSSQHKFCPRAYVLWYVSGFRAATERHYSFDAYVSVGTALHEVNQRWAGRQGWLYGMWKCRKCKAVTQEQLGMPLACPSCGHRKMEYEEYSLVQEHTGLTGHCDGIICLEHLGIPDWLLWEIKTTGHKNTQNINFDPFTDQYYYWHYHQANTYLHMARDGWPLDHPSLPEWEQRPGRHPGFPKLAWILHTYVSRDNPTARKHFLRAPSRPHFDADVYPIIVAKEALKQHLLPAPKCQSGADFQARDCPYRYSCFSPALEGELKWDLVPT